MAQFRMGACADCGQRVIKRGSNVLNVHGTPLNHHLSCTGKPQQLPQTPADEKSSGLSTTNLGEQP